MSLLTFAPLYSTKKHFFIDTNRIVADLDSKLTLKDIAYLCIDHETLIPKDFFFEFLFPSSSKYDFASLKKDTDGIIDFSRIINLDPELENEILDPKNSCQRITIDFEMNKKADYKSFCTHSCNVYPPNIREVMPRTFDVFYWSDFLLKYIYRMCIQIGFLKMDKDRILDKENFMLGNSTKFSDGNEYVKVKSIRNITGFSELANLIESFVLSNPVTEDLIKSREDFELSRTDSTILKMYIQFNELDYSVEHDGSISFIKSIPRIVFIQKDTPTIPAFCNWITLFIESNIHEIFRCFPIFTQLENVFRLQCIKKILNNDINKENNEKLSFIDSFPHSIAISGGVDSEPKVLNQVSQSDTERAECRKAFDRGGLLCSFAPKLLIRKCLEDNEKTFLECLQE
jgi:hypothetical protein